MSARYDITAREQRCETVRIVSFVWQVATRTRRHRPTFNNSLRTWTRVKIRRRSTRTSRVPLTRTTSSSSSTLSPTSSSRTIWKIVDCFDSLQVCTQCHLISVPWCVCDVSIGVRHRLNAVVLKLRTIELHRPIVLEWNWRVDLNAYMRMVMPLLTYIVSGKKTIG